jgi:NTE family protein
MPVRREFKDGHPEQGAAPHDKRYQKALSTLGLSDGGGYDNLGLEPVWKTFETVLVSDGGAVFDPDWDKGLIWRLSRYMKVLGNQVTAMRKRWLVSNFIAHNLDSCHTNPYAMEGTYWGIGTPAERYKKPSRPDGPKERTPRGYTETFVKGSIAPIRTDFDAFTEAERGVLENHGYLLTEAAIHRYLPNLIEPGARDASVPFHEWMDEGKATPELKDSSVVKLLGRW